MSVEDQQITIVGTLGGDPDLKFTPSGAAVCNFSVAVNHRRLNKQTQQWEESGTDWHRVTAWRGMAENITESFKRGDRVIVVGRLASRQYETREGQKVTTWEITADEAGPSTKWATTTQRKAERQTAGQGDQRQGGQYQQGQQRADDPWGSPYQDQANYGGQQQGRQQGGQQGQAPAPADDPWGQPPGRQQGQGAFLDEPPFHHRPEMDEFVA